MEGRDGLERLMMGGREELGEGGERGQDYMYDQNNSITLMT